MKVNKCQWRVKNVNGWWIIWLIQGGDKLDEKYSKWVMVAYGQLSNFSAISWWEQVIFNEMMMMFALFKINTLSWIFIVLAHWNNSPWTDMSIPSDTLFWFRANQFLLFLLNADQCLAEKQQIPILFVSIWRDRVSNAVPIKVAVYE